MRGWEEVILGVICFWLLIPLYAFMVTSIVTDIIRWKGECKNMISLADPDYCMCGDRVDSHEWGDNHSAVSQSEWAVMNLPKLRLGR